MWLQPWSPLSAAPVPVGRRIPPSQREQRSGSGHKAAHCPRNTKGLPTTNNGRQLLVSGLKLTCISRCCEKILFFPLKFIVTRCAAKDCMLSRRASEVKYWTHLSTSDWGRDASSCRSSSSADKPWWKKFRSHCDFTRRKNLNCTMKTYIIQVRQWWFAQEESKIYLASPGQAHSSLLIYNLCSCLILVVCH